MTARQVREVSSIYQTSPGTAAEKYRASITSKGQIVIPAALRRKYGITPKTRIAISDDGEQIVLKPVTHEAITKLCGKYKGTGLLKALLEERAADREREDAQFTRP